MIVLLWTASPLRQFLYASPIIEPTRLAGDFETKDMAALLEEKLGKWQGDSRKPRPEIRRETPEETSAGRKLYLIDRPGATQVRDKFHRRILL